jgi:hypothetical protein
LGDGAVPVKVKPKRFPLEIIQSHMDSYDGYCVNCQEFTADGCTEPDARKYPCELCGEKAVYGAEEAVIRGFITVSGGDE